MAVIEFEFNGDQRMVIPDDDLSGCCAKDIIEGRSYPLPTWDCKPGCILDLGAHAGEFTVMARCRWPGARIVAYEPNPEIIPFLVENSRKYDFEVQAMAVGTETKKVPLYRSKLGSVANSVIAGRPFHTNRSVIVPMARSRDVFFRYKPDVLKLDIEAMELPVLRDAEAFIRSIDIIYVEFHDAADRLALDQLLIPTHELWKATVHHRDRGEMMYVRKGTVRMEPRALEADDGHDSGRH